MADRSYIEDTADINSVEIEPIQDSHDEPPREMPKNSREIHTDSRFESQFERLEDICERLEDLEITPRIEESESKKDSKISGLIFVLILGCAVYGYFYAKNHAKKAQ